MNIIRAMNIHYWIMYFLDFTDLLDITDRGKSTTRL